MNRWIKRFDHHNDSKCIEKERETFSCESSAISKDVVNQFLNDTIIKQSWYLAGLDIQCIMLIMIMIKIKMIILIMKDNDNDDSE